MTIHSPIQITLAPREDGGLRIYSDDLPGLVLSHSDPNAVLDDLGPVLKVFLERAAREETQQGQDRMQHAILPRQQHYPGIQKAILNEQ